MLNGGCRITSPIVSARPANVLWGSPQDGLRWVVFERQNSELQKIKETTLDPAKGEQFLAGSTV